MHIYHLYNRSAILIQYFFYKNVACYTIQLYFAFFTNFSAVSLFENTNLAAYNIFYTAVPILIFSIMARDIYSDKLLAFPSHYSRNSSNRLLTFKELLSWFLQGVWHSSVSFFSWFFFWIHVHQTSDDTEYHSVEYLGFCVYTSVILTVSIKLLFHSRSINWQLIMSALLSILTFLTINMLYHIIVLDNKTLRVLGWSTTGDPGHESPVSGDMYLVSWSLVSSVSVWLTIILVITLSLIPDVVVRVVRKHWRTIREKKSFSTKILDLQLQKGRYKVNKVQVQKNFIDS